MNLKPSARRSHLRKEISGALPRHLWPSLYELQELEHSSGVREAIISVRQFRKGTKGNLISLADLLSPRLQTHPIHTQEEFEEELLRTGRIPKGRPGRPRKDQEAAQIIRLKEDGKSWGEIARKLKKSPEACRQLVRRRLAEMEAENERIEAQIERMKAEVKRLEAELQSKTD
jgi:DNA-binding NarL/FixJ family response regulator